MGIILSHIGGVDALRNRLGQLGRIWEGRDTLPTHTHRLHQLAINLVDPAADVRERPSPPNPSERGGGQLVRFARMLAATLCVQ